MCRQRSAWKDSGIVSVRYTRPLMRWVQSAERRLHFQSTGLRTSATHPESGCNRTHGSYFGIKIRPGGAYYD
jgi:hypothetical protein